MTSRSLPSVATRATTDAAAGVAASHRGTSLSRGFDALGPSTAAVTIALAFGPSTAAVTVALAPNTDFDAFGPSTTNVTIALTPNAIRTACSSAIFAKAYTASAGHCWPITPRSSRAAPTDAKAGTAAPATCPSAGAAGTHTGARSARAGCGAGARLVVDTTPPRRRPISTNT